MDIFITESQDGGYDEEEIVEILLHRFHGNGQHSRLIHNGFHDDDVHFVVYFQFKKKMNEKSLNLRQKGATTAASSSKIFGRTNELDARPVDRMHPREPFEKKDTKQTISLSHRLMDHGTS